MSAILLQNGKQAFTDANSRPLAGGKVFFYAPGTNTLKDTWQDSAQTILNTNPVVLDARGEAAIYGSGPYRQVLRDASNVLVWDAFIPDLAGAIKDAVADLYSKSAVQVANVTALRALDKTVYSHARTDGYYARGDLGAANYYLDASDSTSADNGGTVIVGTDGGRWKISIDGAISVKQFGAHGDGSSDDTIAINKCLAAAQSTYFPATSNGYRITSTLTVPNPGVNIFGDGGSFSSFLSLNGQTFDIFTVTAVSDVEIKNLYAIDFANRGSTPGQLYFARFDDTSNFNVLNVGGNNIHSGILAGKDGSIGGGANSRIEGCKFKRLGAATGVGVHYGGTGEIRELLNSTFAGPGSGSDGTVNALAGVRITGGTAIVIDDVEAPGCGTPLLVQPITGSQVAHTIVSQFWCDSSSSIGMWLDGSLGRIINFSADQLWASSNGVGVRISGYAHDVVINQAKIYQNRSDGIIIDSNSDVLGLIIGGGTHIGGNTGSGISVGLNVGGFRISDCNIGTSSHFGANANGIYLNGGNDLYDINHNAITGNLGAQIVGHAGGTPGRTVKDNIGFITDVAGAFSGTVSATGTLTIAHGMGRAPLVALLTPFGGSSTQGITTQVVSMDATNLVVKMFAGGSVLTTGTFTVYYNLKF